MSRPAEQAARRKVDRERAEGEPERDASAKDDVGERELGGGEQPRVTVARVVAHEVHQAVVFH